MNGSDYDDGSPKRYPWGNQSYREYMGYPAYDPAAKHDPFLANLEYMPKRYQRFPHT